LGFGIWKVSFYEILNQPFTPYSLIVEVLWLNVGSVLLTIAIDVVYSVNLINLCSLAKNGCIE